MEAAVLLARLIMTGQQQLDGTDIFRFSRIEAPRPSSLLIGTADDPPLR